MVDLKRSALLLIDFENYGVHPDGYWAKNEPGWSERVIPAVSNAERALAAARRAGMHVIHVGHAWREGHPEVNPHVPWEVAAKDSGRGVEGTWGVEFFEPLAPREGELVVRKRTLSALAGTELERLLRVKGIETLVLAGIATNFTVESTAREAVDRGYRVLVISDASESMSDGLHRFSADEFLPHICSVVDVSAFLRALDRAERSPTEVVERWVRAMDAHDVDGAAAFFAHDYEDVSPTRPGQEFRGRDRVRRNFAALFESIPDLRAELLRSSGEGATVWMEWRMTGTRRDGSKAEFAGVNVFEVSSGQIDSGRIYTDVVQGAGDIEAQVDRMTQGSDG